MKSLKEESLKEIMESNSWSEWDREMLMRKSNNLFYDQENCKRSYLNIKSQNIEKNCGSKSSSIKVNPPSNPHSEVGSNEVASDFESYDLVESIQDSLKSGKFYSLFNSERFLLF
jgi:hypothetical protein